MRRPDRYAFRGPPKPPRISEAEALRRTLAAIRTMRALPDRERRFLLAGTKSAMPQYVVEFSDLVAQAEQTQDDVDPREVFKPTRADVADAVIAYGWFSQLSLLDWNVREFEDVTARYRAGYGRAALVDDQRFLNWYAAGFTLKLIGERLKLNEHQAEQRLEGIAENLCKIANGRAKLADIVERQRTRKLHQARSRDLARRAGI